MADFERQLDILPPRSLVHPVHIIGLGGIGSPAAYLVRKMGFSNLTLWDHDTLEPRNLPSQHYEVGDLGKPKVEGMRRQLEQCLDEPSGITAIPERFTSSEQLEGIIISGVDSMKSRQEIWDAVKKSKAFAPLYIDGRVGIEWNEEKGKVAGEWIEVFTIAPPRIEDCELYEAHIFSDEEAAPLHCTAQAVAYVGFLIAGFIGANLRKWVTQEPYHRYILYECLTSQVLIATL